MKYILDTIIPEPVLGHTTQLCSRHCTPAYLSYPLYQIIPSAQEWAGLKILSLLEILTRYHHTRAILRSVMFQVLLSCISLIPSISDHPISPGMGGIKYTRYHHTRASLGSVMFQTLHSCISLIPPISDHPISPGTGGIKNSFIA